MNIYLDIETIPGQSESLFREVAAGIAPPGNISKPETLAKWEQEKKPAIIEEAWRKTAFHGDRGEVVCIAWAIDDEPPDCVFRGLPGQKHNSSESLMLWEFVIAISEAINRHGGRWPVFVGHNVRDFDLRFLFHRCVILGIKPSFRLPHDVRPGSEQVFDTMTAWSGWGGRISLDRLCRALGVPTKGSELSGVEIDGSKVWDFVRDGRIEEVATYCKADVERVRQVYRRITFANPQTMENVA